MQLTNAQVLNVLQSLNTLSQKKLPIKLAWKITTAVRSLEPFAKAVDEPLTDIRTKHALKDQNGNLVEAVGKDGNPIPNTLQIPNDKITIVNQEMDELLLQKVEVVNVNLKLSDFPDTLELEPTVLSGLLPIITEDSTDLSLVK
jgi:hypothetical protein